MDTVLILVTLVALSMTATMGAITWRLLQEERRRSAARVAALEAGADVADLPPDAPAEPVTPSAAPVPAGAGSAELFAELQEAGNESSPRLLAALVAGLAMVMLGAGLMLVAGSDRPDAVTAAAPDGAPLELLSLGHAQQDEGLTIRGLVRNRAAGREVHALTAIALAFDRQGELLASGRGPVEFRVLGSGEESPFVISLEGAGTAARYRVSFRNGEGRVVAHVDRRTAGAPAPNP